MRFTLPLILSVVTTLVALSTADTLSDKCTEGSTTYACNDNGNKVDISNCETANAPMATGFYANRYFMIGDIQVAPTSSNSYNLSRTGQFREIYVTKNQVTLGDSGCSTGTDKIVPPYDQDVSTVIGLTYCYHMAGTAGFGGVTYTGTSVAGVATFGCAPWLGINSIMARQVSSTCKTAILKAEGKAVKVCTRVLGEKQWRYRDGAVEEIGISATTAMGNAIAICRSMGGSLGAIKNTSHMDSIVSTYFTDAGHVRTDRVWAGFDCPSGGACVWDDGTTPFGSQIDVDKSGSRQYITYYQGSKYKGFNDQNHRDTLPFFCSRPILSLSTAVASGTTCYKGLTCSLVVTLSIKAQWHNLPSDTTALTFSIQIGSAAAATASFGSQAQAVTISATAPNTVGAATVLQLRTAGYQYAIRSTSTITVSDFLKIGITTTASLTQYANQVFTITATRPTTDASTLTTTSPIVQTVGGWSGTTATITCKGTSAGSFPVTFAVSGAPNFYYTTTNPESLTFTILAQDTISVSSTATGAVIVVDDQFTVTLTLSKAVTQALTVTATLSSGAPLQVVSGSFVWASGDSALTKTVTYKATATNDPMQPTITFTHTSPQFVAVATPWSVLINPKIQPTLRVDSQSMATLQAFSVYIDLTKVYKGTASFALACTGTTIAPAAQSVATAQSTQKTLTFSIQASVATTCSLGLTVTGTASSNYNPATALALTFTSNPVVSVVVVSSCYALETKTLELRATPAAELSTNSHVVVVSVTGTLIGAVQFSGSTTLTLTQANPTATLTFSTTRSGMGTFAFTVQTRATGFPATIDAVSFTIHALHSPSLVTALSASQALGSAYVQTLSVQLPALPDGATTVTTTVSVSNSAALAVSPVSVQWVGTETALTAKSVVLTANAVAADVSVFLSVTTTSVRFNTTMLLLEKITTYRRVWLGAALSTQRVYGTYTATLTLTSPTTLTTSALVVDVTLPSEISGTPSTTITIAAGQTTGSAVLTPTAQPNVNRTITLDFADSNPTWLLAWYETAISPVYLTVTPLIPVSASCNATQLYFASEFSLRCTLSITSLPSSGSLTITPVASTYFVFDSTGQTFLSTSMVFNVNPKLDATFTDYATAPISFTISDSSFSFAVPSAVTVTLRKVVTTTLALINAPSGGFFVGPSSNPSVNSFLVQVTFATAPDTGVTITGDLASTGPAMSGITFNASVVTVTSSTTSLTTVYRCWTTTAGTVALQMPVSGSSTFAPRSNILSVTLNALLIVSFSTSAASLYSAQNTSFQVALSSSLSDGKETVVTLAYFCGASASPSSVSISPASITFSGNTFVVSGTIVALTTPCTSGGLLRATLSGTSTTVDMSTSPTAALTILSRKQLTYVPTTPLTLYCGGLNTTSFEFRLSSLPSASFVALSIATDSTSAGLLTWTSALLNFTKDSPATFLSTTVRQTGSCASVPSSGLNAIVTITLASSDAVTAEYDTATLTPLSYTIRLLPLLTITAPTQLAQRTMFVGDVTTFDVTLPQAPNGAVTVTASSNASLVVSVHPTTVTLTASILSQTFTVTALTASYARIVLAYSGNASQYLPQTGPQLTLQTLPLGVVTVSSTVPTNVFISTTFSIIVTSTMFPLTGYNTTRVTFTSSDPNAAYASPSVLSWAPGGTALTQAVTINATAKSSAVTFTLTLTADRMFQQSLNLRNFTLSVVDARQIVWSLPPFVYVGDANVEAILVQLAVSPATALSLTLSAGAGQAVAVNIDTAQKFTSSTSRSQSIAIRGVSPLATMQLSMSLGEGGADYDTPAPLTTQIRALETFTVTGLPSAMYVGQQVTFSVTLSRLPTCASGQVVLSPTSNAPANVLFLTSSLTFGSTDSSLLQQATVQAVAATILSPAALSFPVTGSCSRIYSTTLLNAPSTMRVYNLERVSLIFASSYTDASGAFVYLGNDVPLTVSLGTPAIYHDAPVVVTVSYTGPAQTVSFSETVVTLAPGVNSTTILVRGLAVTTAAASLSVVVTQGSATFLPAATMPVLRVLALIPLTVNFDPATQLMVVGSTQSIAVRIPSAALYGACVVSFTYGSQLLFQPVTVAALTVTKDFNVVALPQSVSAVQNMTLVLSGIGAGHYLPSRTLWQVAVVPVLFVNVTVPAASVYVGAVNSVQLIVELGALPTMGATDSITVTFASSQYVTWSVASIQLTETAPRQLVRMTGVLGGTISLTSALTVTSVSGQYNATVSPQNHIQSVLILAQVAVSVSRFTTAMFEGDTQDFSIRIPQLPLSGTLTVTPTFSSSLPGFVFTPSSVTFTSSSTELSANFTLYAPTRTPTVSVHFVTSGSTEYLSTAATESLQVSPANVISIYDWKEAVYIGAKNEFTFGLSIRRLPNPTTQLTVTLALNTASYTLSPSNVLIFNTSRPLAQQVVLRGVAPTALTGITVTVVDTDNFFEPVAALSLTVLALERFSGTVSRQVVYSGQQCSVTVTLTKPPIAPMTLNLVMQLPWASNQNAYTLMTLSQYAVTPAQSIILLPTNQTATFTITALATGIAPHISFAVLDSAASAQFDSTALPAFDVRFVALRTISISGANTIFVGLEAKLHVTLSAVPDSGTSVSLVVNAPSSIRFTPSSVTFTDTLSETFTVIPSAAGVFDVSFATQFSGTVAYSSTTVPSQWRFTVTNPSVLALIPPSTPAFIGTANQFLINVTGAGTMSSGETLYVNLTTTTPSLISIFPTTVELSSMTPSFTVIASAAVSTVFRMTFASSINRFVLASEYMTGGAGLPLQVAPLKTVTVGALSSSSIYVLQTATVDVTISSLPVEGHVLIATIGYAGSLSSVVLSVPVTWTSESTSLTQTLSIQGTSPASTQDVRVSFSGAPEYAVATVSRPLTILAFLLVDVAPPLQMFVGTAAAVSLYIEQSRVINLVIAFSIPNAVQLVTSTGAVIADSTVMWAYQDSQAKTAYLKCLMEGEVTLSFTVEGQERSVFATPSPISVTCLPVSSVLVNAPGNEFTVYMSSSNVVRLTLQVAFKPLLGTLIVTPTLVCASSGPIATFQPTVAYFNESQPLSTTIFMFGVLEGGPCDLTFPLSGVTTGFTGNRRFKVYARPLLNITLGAVPSDIFIGEANQLTLSFSLSSATPLPLTSAVSITLAATVSPCIVISPLTLTWAALSATETYTKTATVLATCSSETPQKFQMAVTASTIFLNNVPSSVLLNARELLDVTVRDPEASDRNYNMYVGGSLLTLEAVLGGNVSSSESLVVRAVYAGLSGSLDQIAAQWQPSGGVPPRKKPMVLIPSSVSPIAAISFVVEGPPRFKATAVGTGTLQIIGPLRVTCAFPTAVVEGTQFTVQVTLGGRLTAAETLRVEPRWFGVSGALLWTPAYLSFDSATLQRDFIFTAVHPQAGYRLRFDVSGSIRFVSVAYDSTVVIEAALPIVSTALPTQLMKGQRYALGIDVGILPPAGTNSFVYVYTKTISGPQCIEFPSGSTFNFSSANQNEPTVVTVPVTVSKLGCPPNELPFAVLPTSYYKYSRNVESRTFETVSAGPVSLDWPRSAYVGTENAMTALLLLVEPITNPTVSITISITAVTTTGVLTDVVLLSTTTATFSFGGSTSAEIKFSKEGPGTVTFSFVVTSTLPAWHGIALTTQTVTFYSLLSLRLQQPVTSFYAGINNMPILALVADSELRPVDTTQAMSFTVYVDSEDGTVLAAQPSSLTWTPGSNLTQFVYLLGVRDAPSVTFRFRLVGNAAKYVGTMPAAQTVAVLKPLIVARSASPESIYVGAVNRVRLAVTVPLRDATFATFTVRMSITGDSSAFTVSPSVLTWTAANDTATQQTGYFWVTGVYSSGIANQITYTLVTGPTWATMQPVTALETRLGTQILDLQSLQMIPDVRIYEMFNNLVADLRYTPGSAIVRCISQSPQHVGVVVSPGNTTAGTAGTITLSTYSPGTSILNCSVNDTTFGDVPTVLIRSLARKTVSVTPSVLYTYAGVSTTFTVTLQGAPLLGGLLVMEPNTTETAASFSIVPSALAFSATVSTVQLLTVRGVNVTGDTGQGDVLAVPLLISGVTHEYLLQSLRFLYVSVLPFLRLTTRCATVSLTGTSSTAPLQWYVASGNFLELQFSIPRATVFSQISVYPVSTSSALKFCTLAVCTAAAARPVSVTQPATISGIMTTVSVYVHADSAAVETLSFNVLGGVDYQGGPSMVTVGAVSFRQLEQMVLDGTKMRALVYVGAANSQTLYVRPSAAGLGAQVAELVMSFGQGIVRIEVVSAPVGVSATDRGAGLWVLSWTGTSAPLQLRVTGLVPYKTQSISLVWRNQPTNFASAIAPSYITFGVASLLVFGVTLGTTELQPSVLHNVVLFMGVQNGISPIISIPILPVLDTDSVQVHISTSNPAFVSLATKLVVFGASTRGGRLTFQTSMYAFTRTSAVNLYANVTFTIIAPSEFHGNISYTMQLEIKPLQTLTNTLTTRTIAIGVENAVTFMIQPRLPVSLTLNSLVTCGEVSFTSNDLLVWDRSMEAKSMTVSATAATGLVASRCLIVTYATGGSDASTFENPPFNATIFSLERPRILYSPPPQTLGTSVASAGLNLSIGLQGTYWKWTTTKTLQQLLLSRAIVISSSRSISDEPQSTLALLAAQMQGASQFFRLNIDSEANILYLSLGPGGEFQPTSLETVTIRFGAGAIHQGSSLESSLDTAELQVKGVKKTLFSGSSGAIIGSGAASAAAAGGALSMASASQANKMQTIINSFICPNPDWRLQQDSLDWNDQPIRISFGSIEDLGTYTAVAVMNTVIIVGCAALHGIVAILVYLVRLRGSYADKTFRAARAAVRYPSFLLFPVMFLYQTIVSASLTTIMYSPSLAMRMMAAVCFVVIGFGIPVYTYIIIGPGFEAKFVTEEDKRREKAEQEHEQTQRAIRGDNAAAPSPSPNQGPRHVSSDDDDDPVVPPADAPPAAAAAPPPEKPKSAFRRMMSVFKPCGVWTHKQDPQWIKRYSMFFEEFRGGFHWFFAIDVSMTFLLGVIDGIQPIDNLQCLGRTAGYVLLFFLQFLSVLLCRPYNTLFGNVFFVIAYFLQFASMLFVAVAVFQQDPAWGGVSVSINMLMLFGVMLLVKTLVDVLQSVNDHFDLESFFDEKEDEGVKMLKGEVVEKQLVQHLQQEMTSQLVARQNEKRRAEIAYAISGPPRHDGRTFEEIEEELNDQHMPLNPEDGDDFNPRRYFAEYRGPQGATANSDEERMMDEQEQKLYKAQPKVKLAAREAPSHYEDPATGERRFTTRLDNRYEAMLKHRLAEQQQAKAAGGVDVASPAVFSDVSDVGSGERKFSARNFSKRMNSQKLHATRGGVGTSLKELLEEPEDSDADYL